MLIDINRKLGKHVQGVMCGLTGRGNSQDGKQKRYPRQ